MKKFKNILFIGTFFFNRTIVDAQSFQGMYAGGGISYLLNTNTNNRSNSVGYSYFPKNGTAFQLGTSLDYRKHKINISLFYAEYRFQQKLNNIILPNDIKNKTTTTIDQTTSLEQLGIDIAYEKYIKKNTSFSIAAQGYRVLPSIIDKKITGAGVFDTSISNNSLYQYSKFDFSVSISFNQYIRLSKILKLCISPQFRIVPHKQQYFFNSISSIQIIPQMNIFLHFSKKV
jgi:hypothetical protein